MSGQQTTVSVSGAWYTGSLQPMLARSRYASMRDRDRRPLLRGTANEWTCAGGRDSWFVDSSLMMQVLLRNVDRMPYDQGLPEPDIQLIRRWVGRDNGIDL